MKLLSFCVFDHVKISIFLERKYKPLLLCESDLFEKNSRKYEKTHLDKDAFSALYPEKTPAKMKAAYFSAGNLSKPETFLDRFEVYRRIADGTFSEETNFIQTKHREGILERFKSIPKSEYQADKKRLLAAVCFSGEIDRGKGIEDDFRHAGIINLDIDDNEPEKQRQLFERVNKIPWVEAAARSISGKYTADMWVNVRIEIPPKEKKLSKRLQKLLGLKGGERYAEVLKVLHEAYHRALSAIFWADAGIKVGNAKDLKRVRYLTADAGIYVAIEATLYTLAALEEKLTELQKSQPAGRPESLKELSAVKVDLKTSDAFEYAEAFTRSKGYIFEPGQRHHFRTHLAIACNLLGVDQAEAEAYIFTKYPEEGGRITTNCVSFPYQAYADAFGAWRFRLAAAEKPADYSFTLAPGEKVSKYSVELAEVINREKLTDLVAGTGAGKSYAVCKEIAKELKRLNGCPTIVVTSLNAKSEKDGQQYGLPVITGAALKKAGLHKKKVLEEALKADVILTSQNYAPTLLQMFARAGKGVNVAIDESHSLISGGGYRGEVISKLFAIAKTARTLTLMTGTPKPYFRALGFCRVEVHQADRQKLQMIVRTRPKGKAALTALQHAKQTDFDSTRLLIKIQSKKQLKLTSELLKAELGLKPEEILILYADKTIKESDEYQAFLRANKGEESFFDTVKVVLTTSVIGEGLDVYGEAKRLEFVNIEKSSSFDVCALIQFDRWRTDQGEKTLYSYHPNSGKAPAPDFCEVRKFLELLKFWGGEAEHLNSKKAQLEEVCADVALLALRTQYSQQESFLLYDRGTDKYRVNEVALAAFVDAQKVQATTTDRGLSEISRSYPYVQITDERTAGDLAAEASPLLKGITDALREERAAAQAKLIELFDTDRETLFQAIGTATEDTELKSQIDFHESRKDAASALKKANPELFEVWQNDTERLAKMFFSCTRMQIPEEDFSAVSFKATEDGQRVLESAEKFAAFMKGLKLHTALKMLDLDSSQRGKHLKALTALQLCDAHTLRKVVDQLQSAGAKSRLTPADMIPILNQTGVHHSERSAVKFARVFFELKRITSGKSAAYEVGERIDFEAYLESHGIRKKFVLENLHKLLKIS